MTRGFMAAGGWQPTPGGLGIWTLHVPGGPALMSNAILSLEIVLRDMPDGPQRGALSRLLEACRAANDA